MSELVQKLLLLARFEAGAMTFVFEQVPFRTVLEEAVQHFESRASYEKKQLLFRCGSDPDILCDRFWLVEALSNLIKNALDHTQEGGMITVETRFTMQSVQIMIEDNGEGIDPRDLPHIFKRFYRSPHAGTSHGIGLGLPLAQAIIEADHGTIQVLIQTRYDEIVRKRGTILWNFWKSNRFLKHMEKAMLQFTRFVRPAFRSCRENLRQLSGNPDQGRARCSI